MAFEACRNTSVGAVQTLTKRRHRLRGTAFGWRCHQPALKGEVDMSVSEWTEGL